MLKKGGGDSGESEKGPVRVRAERAGARQAEQHLESGAEAGERVQQDDELSEAARYGL